MTCFPSGVVMESGELPLDVKGDPSVPNFLLQLCCFLLQRLSCDDFVRDLECGGKLVLEADELV